MARQRWVRGPLPEPAALAGVHAQSSRAPGGPFLHSYGGVSGSTHCNTMVCDRGASAHPGGQRMERVGGYELLGLIGEGGMGEVWRAQDLTRGREVALKLLPAHLSEDTEYQRRFRRESHLVARLREPHLIPIHDYGEVDGRLFIDMRLVEGRSLQELLREEGPLPAVRTIGLFAQIAEALDAAHADGLVHRDVKPSNVLVTPHDFVYVVDFGLAYAVGTPRSELTQTGVAMGTLEYMAPERFSKRSVDARTDVYSLACVFFECLTARKPFPGDFPTQMYGHLNLDPPRASEGSPGIPAAFDAVIARGMAKDPGHRFATASLLVVAAREALEDGARAVTAAGRATRRSVPAASPAGAELYRNAVTAAIAPGVPGPRRPADEARNRASVGAGTRPATDHAGVRSDPPAPGAMTRRPPHPSGPTPGGPLPGLSGPATKPALPTKRPRQRLLWATVGAVAMIATVVALVVVVGPDTDRPAPRAAPAASNPHPSIGGVIPVGSEPVAMQVAPDGRFAYIANHDAGTITVFDTIGGVATGTIIVPDGGPQNIVFSPDGRRAFVSIVGDTAGEVGVVDTATGSVVARIPLGSRPQALAVAPDGERVYASEPDAGSVTVIDTGTSEVVGRVAVAPTPHGLAFSPDGSRLAVADYDANLITLIDAAVGRPAVTASVGRSPHAVVWHPSQPWVFDTNFADNSLSVTDAQSGRVLATVPTAIHPQAISLSADGRHAYVAAIDANVVQVLDTTTFQITATIPTGRGPSSVAVAPDGLKAWVTDMLDGTLTVLNVAGQ